MEDHKKKLKAIIENKGNALEDFFSEKKKKIHENKNVTCGGKKTII